MAKPKRLGQRLAIYVAPAMAEAIQAAAEAHMTTATDCIRRAIAERLTRDGFFALKRTQLAHEEVA